MKDVSRREFLKTLCLGITVAALQNLPMTTAFADSAISKTKIISKSDREIWWLLLQELCKCPTK